MPEISVIMSTYNEKLEHLRKAIESVQKQTFQDYEFIIVLDNPQNHAIRNCVYHYAQNDKRIRVIENERNLGLTQSLNKAMKTANGTYMARMDADDIMAKSCLARELDEIKTHHLDFVSASKINIDEHGHKLGTYINDFSPKQMQKLLPYDNSVNHPTVMVRLDLVLREGGYREIPSCEDYDLWLRLLFHHCRMRILPNILLLYRIRANGICESNAYRLYLSKRFLLGLCQQSKKNPQVWKDKHAFKKYLRRQDTSPEKEKRFNQAHALLYQGISCLNRKHALQAVRLFIQAVHLDKDILWIIKNKLGYQLRKRIILSVPAFHIRQTSAPRSAAQ